MDWFPYDREFRHERVNLKTGKQAFKATETYLLTALEKRISKRDTLIEKCQKRGNMVEELIKKNQISNFETKKYSKKNKSIQALKIQQEKGTRGKFG